MRSSIGNGDFAVDPRLIRQLSLEIFVANSEPEIVRWFAGDQVA